MIELFLTVIPSICWLVYRCYKLFQMPVSEIVQDLHIEIPHIPNICIDSITKDSVVIHWDIEVRPDESLVYVVLVNNREAATLSSSSCKFSDLQHNKLYQIQVIAVNSLTNFRSQAYPVFIETLPSVDEEVERLVECDAKTSDVSLDSTLSADLNEKEVKHMNDPALLRNYLDIYQHSLGKINKEFRTFNDAHNNEFLHLRSELENFKKILLDKTNAQNKKGTILKDHQKKKEHFLHQKTKLLAQLENAKNAVNIHESNLLDLYHELDKLNEKKAALQKYSDNQENDTRERMKRLEREIATARMNNKIREDEVRTVKMQKKKLSKLLDELKALADSFGDACFNKDYTLTAKGLEVVNNLFALNPEWEREITLELSRLAEFEHNWRSAFKNEIKNYVTIQNKLETIRLNLNTDYAPNYVSEYSASIHFGGYTNAISKKKKPIVANTTHSSSSSSPLPSSATAVDTFHFYNDVYTKDEQGPISIGNTQSPVQDNLIISNPSLLDRPSSPIGQGYLTSMAGSSSMIWNNSNNATMPTSDKELVSPPSFSIFNQSSSSLNRYSPTLWNDNSTHTRNISGSSLQMRRGLESDFRPFDTTLNGSTGQLAGPTTFGSPFASQLGSQASNAYLSAVPLANVNSLASSSFMGMNNQPNFLSPLSGSEPNLGPNNFMPSPAVAVPSPLVGSPPHDPSVSSAVNAQPIPNDGRKEKYLGY